MILIVLCGFTLNFGKPVMKSLSEVPQPVFIVREAFFDYALFKRASF